MTWHDVILLTAFINFVTCETGRNDFCIVSFEFLSYAFIPVQAMQQYDVCRSIS